MKKTAYFTFGITLAATMGVYAYQSFNYQDLFSYVNIKNGSGIKDVIKFSLVDENKSQEEAKKVKGAKMIFVGDIMLSRDIGGIMARKNDWTYPFLNVADFLKSADLTFGNLEGPMSDRGENVGSIYSFRDDPRSVAGLTFAGFDVLSFANNHVWDYGQDAFLDTMDILNKNGISYIGAGKDYTDAHKPIVKDVNGTKVAFLGYTNLVAQSHAQKSSEPAVAFPYKDEMVSDIKNAKSMADVVVVSFHFGEEYKILHNDYQEKLAHEAIDAGSNLVIGHHPHVVEDTEEYHGGYIAYSLGNFIFDQNFSQDTSRGMVLEANLKDKKIADIKKHEVNFNSSYQPSLVE